MFQCPVCAYGELREPAVDLNICPCCGTQFGYDDVTLSYDALRREWLGAGAQWFSNTTPPPPHWNGYRQILNSGLGVAPTANRADREHVVVIGDWLRMPMPITAAAP
jgi:hypothetical protein